MKYSLADYILNIQSNDPDIAAILTGNSGLSIGGEGSALESINIKIDNELFSTTSYATGGWVHEKNLARNGTIDVTLNQLSKNVAKFKQLCNMYYGKDYASLTITLVDSEANEIARCEDCFIKAIPVQDFKGTSSTQTWSLTAGKITFN